MITVVIWILNEDYIVLFEIVFLVSKCESSADHIYWPGRIA